MTEKIALFPMENLVTDQTVFFRGQYRSDNIKSEKKNSMRRSTISFRASCYTTAGEPKENQLNKFLSGKSKHGGLDSRQQSRSRSSLSRLSRATF